MPQETLEIAWRLADPALPPRDWHKWAQVPEAAPGDDALEARLAWPAGTIATLRAAFHLRLGRGTGWEDAEHDASAVTTAARVFKRGVGVRAAGRNVKTRQLSGRYAIRIDHDGAGAQAALAETPSFVVADATVAKLWPDVAARAGVFLFAGDEHAKTLDSVAAMLEGARRAGNPKTWTLVGGGILTDIGAFAAWLAGANVIMVPTTLLAMADASVGGKTGVNFPPYGKNQVGAFHFPEHVAVSTTWLKTLPPRDLLAGGAECLKHAFLSGDLALAERLAKALKKPDLVTLGAALPDVIRFKAEVVAEDPGESGKRAVLNFGHTLGHALEAMSQAATTGETTLLHGEAIGIGMAFALILSRHVAGLAEDAEREMLRLLRDTGLIPSGKLLSERLGVQDFGAMAVFGELTELMAHDKKNTASAGTTTQWVLLSGPGTVAQPARDAWTTPVASGALRPAWSEFLALFA